jgi:hypothetical protein
MTAHQLRRRSLLWFILYVESGNFLFLRASQIVDQQIKSIEQGGQNTSAPTTFLHGGSCLK